MSHFFEYIDHDLNFHGETKLLLLTIYPKNLKMYLKNINGNRLLVLNFHIRRVRKDLFIV